MKLIFDCQLVAAWEQTDRLAGHEQHEQEMNRKTGSFWFFRINFVTHSRMKVNFQTNVLTVKDMTSNNLTAFEPKKMNSRRNSFALPVRNVRTKNTYTPFFPITSGNERFLFVVDWQLTNPETNPIDQSKFQIKKDHYRL